MGKYSKLEKNLKIQILDFLAWEIESFCVRPKVDSGESEVKSCSRV
jgi:hypothetical protein